MVPYIGEKYLLGGLWSEEPSLLVQTHALQLALVKYQNRYKLMTFDQGERQLAEGEK